MWSWLASFLEPLQPADASPFAETLTNEAVYIFRRATSPSRPGGAHGVLAGVAPCLRPQLLAGAIRCTPAELWRLLRGREHLTAVSHGIVSHCGAVFIMLPSRAGGGAYAAGVTRRGRPTSTPWTRCKRCWSCGGRPLPAPPPQSNSPARCGRCHPARTVVGCERPAAAWALQVMYAWHWTFAHTSYGKWLIKR